jgi:hypothetical protein
LRVSSGDVAPLDVFASVDLRRLSRGSRLRGWSRHVRCGPEPRCVRAPGADASLDAARVSEQDALVVGPTSSLDDLVAAYSPTNAEAFVQGVLERRYPHGWTLVREGRGGFIDCLMTFLSD